MKTTTLTIIQSSVATSFSGGIYIDVPFNCVLVGVNFAMTGAANAANVSEMLAELSTGVVNQYSGGSGKNILATAANFGVANSGGTANSFVPMSVPLKSGERIYLNALNPGANWVRHLTVATLILAA